MKRLVALLLCSALALPGCATARASTRTFTTGGPGQDRPTASGQLLADYARQLPPGTRVRVTLSGNRALRGTLLRVTDTDVAIQPRTRVPEPPVEVRFDDLEAIEIEQPNGIGRTIAIGAAVGAGAAVGVLLILAAIFADD